MRRNCGSSARPSKLGARVYSEALNAIRPGVRESEVAGKLEYAARQAGADGMSFETIVAAGKRSALPHGRASSQPIPRRGFVVVDSGVILRGYCSDMTRTVHVGRVSREERRWYEAVLEAQLAGIAAVVPGKTAGRSGRGRPPGTPQMPGSTVTSRTPRATG